MEEGEIFVGVTRDGKKNKQPRKMRRAERKRKRVKSETTESS